MSKFALIYALTLHNHISTTNANQEITFLIFTFAIEFLTKNIWE